MPKSSGFFFLAQVGLTIHSANDPMSAPSYNMSDIAFDDLGDLRAGTDPSACRRLSGPIGAGAVQTSKRVYKVVIGL